MAGDDGHDGDRERDSLVVEAPGADEVQVVPWPLLWRDRVARRVEGSDRYRWWVLATALVGLFSVTYTITILAVSLPGIAEDLRSDTATLTWVITGPLLAFGVVGPALGKAGDVWGHKRIYVLGLLGTAVFAVLSTAAWNASSLIVFRVLGAVEGAATGPASVALISRVFAREDRVKALGWWALVGAGAPVLGLAAGGFVVEQFGWRWVFVPQIPMCLLAAGLAMAVLPEHKESTRRAFDVPGAVTLGAGITALLFALNRGPAWGWASPGVLGAFAAGAATLALFVVIERRAPQPLVPLAWLRNRDFAAPVAAQLFSNFAYMGGFILTPLLLERSFGYDESEIGLLVMARPLSFALSAPVAGYLTVRLGERRAVVSGTMLVAASMVVLAAVSPGSHDGMVVLALALSGLGLGVSSPAASSTVANAVDEADLGVAGAAQQLVVQVGIVAGIQVMQTVQSAREPTAGLVPSFGDAYLVGGAVALLGVLASLWVRSLGRTPAARDDRRGRLPPPPDGDGSGSRPETPAAALDA